MGKLSRASIAMSRGETSEQSYQDERFKILKRDSYQRMTRHQMKDYEVEMKLLEEKNLKLEQERMRKDTI